MEAVVRLSRLAERMKVQLESIQSSGSRRVLHRLGINGGNRSYQGTHLLGGTVTQYDGAFQKFIVRAEGNIDDVLSVDSYFLGLITNGRDH